MRSLAALFILGALRLAPSALGVRDSVDSKLESELESDLESELEEGSGPFDLHVIGDSHGDQNYLYRCLLSTGLFELKSSEPTSEKVSWSLVWKDDPKVRARDFEVVVLGDAIDRGTHSLQNLQLLKELADHKVLGKRLVFLLGNHESMMIRLSHSYADASDMSKMRRLELLTATKGRDSKLAEWLTRRPVVYLSHGVLMTHGGLSLPVLELALKDESAGWVKEACKSGRDQCGRAITDHINELAHGYYQQLHECAQAKGLEKADQCKGGEMPYPLGKPGDKRLKRSWTKGDGGVLWFRGFSSLKDGANTARACQEASKVGKYLGATMMPVAHSTHEEIYEFCSEDSMVPIYTLDTHPSDCRDMGECDFDPSKLFHLDDEIEYDEPNVPQSLLVRFGAKGAHELTKKCLSKVEEDGEVKRGCSEITKLPTAAAA